MPYEVSFRPAAEEDLKKLAVVNKAIAQRILSKIKWLAANSTLVNHEPLSGEWSGFYKRRVGDYRIIYMIDTYNQHLEICVVGHRKDIYKLE